jgi:hypothetical protein
MTTADADAPTRESVADTISEPEAAPAGTAEPQTQNPVPPSS